jgi:hypothetical protein
MELLYVSGKEKTAKYYETLSLESLCDCDFCKLYSVFDYSQVMFASLWGALFFAELPDRWSILGYVIIIGTALYR